MRAHMKKSLTETVPTHPDAGEVSLICVHKPTPQQGAHFFWLSKAIDFTSPEGIRGTSQWIMLCQACNRRFADDMKGAIERDELPIGGHITWHDGMRGVESRGPLS